MRCPNCAATEFAGFNGFVLCVPDGDGVPHRFTNDAFNALVDAFDNGDEPDVAPEPAPPAAPADPEPEVVEPEPEPELVHPAILDIKKG